MFFSNSFALRNQRFYVYNKYIKNLFYIRFYSLFIHFLFKELQIFLNKKQIKTLRHLPFITLYRDNSQKINIKLNYRNFFSSNQIKYFTYK